MKIENYHPIAIFTYFMTVIFLTMFVQNPIIIGASFVGAISICFCMFNAKEMLKSLFSSLLLLICLTLINPLIVHRGVTELLFINGKPITLEALLYGLFLTLMLISIFYWFKAYNKLITSDKFLYLFSRISPKISIMLSMSMAFIPTLKQDYLQIKDSQDALGIYMGDNFIDKVRGGLRIASILFSMAIEDSIQKAESMQARGYGIKGRTSFSIFRFKKSDFVFVLFNLIFIIIIAVFLAQGIGSFNYYPIMTTIYINTKEIIVYVVSMVLYLLGCIACIKEMVVWKISLSKI